MKQTEKLNLALDKLKEPTKLCLVCFDQFKQHSLRTLFAPKYSECDKCFNLKKPIFLNFELDGVKGLAIYKYDEVIKERIYQLKGCYDYVLSSSFLESYSWLLRLLYFGYTLVPMPSSKEGDERRGFNHVVEIFKQLNLKIEPMFYKNCDYKQSDQNKEDRVKIKDIICLKEDIDFKGKNILLVDDIITTGNTLKTCINLLKNKGVKKMQILTYSAGQIFVEETLREKPTLSLKAKRIFASIRNNVSVNKLKS